MTRAAIAAGLAWAVIQAATGSISGTITDPSGGLIPGVRVTATLGASRRVTTSDVQGRFRLDNLPPGLYELEARLAGFETEIDDHVNVSAGVAIVWNRKLLLGGFDPPEISRTPFGPDPMPPAVARPVYAAVLGDIFKNAVPDRLVIEAASVIPSRPDREDWETTLLGAPAELRTRLNDRTSRETAWLNPAALPPGTQLVPRATIIDVFRSAPKSDQFGGWETFRRQYGVSSSVGLSRVIVTADGRDAVVYFEHRCGNVCGEGTLLWLRRITADGPWIVRARRGFWVS